MPVLSEDDIYRTSTQYRLWSFTRESLSSLRSTTNQSAADGVRAALKSIHSQQTAGETEGQSSHDEATRPTNYVKEVDCLTVEEELKLVGFYCVKTMQFADFCEFPTNVKVEIVSILILEVLEAHSSRHDRLQLSNISSASISPILP